MKIPKNMPKWLPVLFQFVAKQQRYSDSQRKRLLPSVAEVEKHWPNFVRQCGTPAPASSKKTSSCVRAKRSQRRDGELGVEKQEEEEEAVEEDSEQAQQNEDDDREQAQDAAKVDDGDGDANENAQKEQGAVGDDDDDETMKDYTHRLHAMPGPLKEALRTSYHAGGDGGDARSAGGETAAGAGAEAGLGTAPATLLSQVDQPHQIGAMASARDAWQKVDMYADELYDRFNDQIEQFGLQKQHPLVASVDDLYEVTKGVIHRQLMH